MSGVRTAFLVAVAAFFPLRAQGGGFELPGTGTRAMGRGSAFTVGVDDLSAIALNPGGLLRLRGTSLLLSDNLIFSNLTFTRAASVIPQDPGVTPAGTNPLATTKNTETVFPLGAMVALGSTFGLEDWSFAVGVFGPNAVGKVHFDPLAGARYMLTDLDMVLIYYSAAVAYGKKDLYGVGLTLSLADLPKSKFGVVVDGGNNPSPNPYFNSFDLKSTLDLKYHSTFTAIVGGWWRVMPQLELGLSGRVVPVALHPKGKVRLDKIPGQLFAGNETAEVVLQGADVALDLTLPVTANLGARYRYVKGDREVFDVELDAGYEAWSAVNAYDVKLDGSVRVTAKSGDGTVDLIPKTGVKSISIPKRWKDTMSVRLGGTWNAVKDLFSVSAGGFWESGATPQNYSNVDFPSFMRFGAAGGVRFRFRGTELSASYMHVFQQDRSVDESAAKVFQQRPLFPCPDNCTGKVDGVPANAGTFKAGYDQVQLGVSLYFDEWF